MTAETEKEKFDEESAYEYEEEPQLSRNQRLWAVASGVISFLLFLVVLFPFEGILKSTLKKKLAPAIRLEFATMKPGWIGQSKIEDLSIFTEGGFRLEAETTVADLKKLSLFRASPEGQIRLTGGYLGSGNFGGSFRSLDIRLDLSSVMAPPSQWEGSIQLKLDRFEPEQLPGILAMLPATPEELVIERLTLPLQFKKGTVEFHQTQLQNPLFTVRIEGTGRLGSTVMDSSLDGRVCLRPVDDLETRNEGIYNYYIMNGGTAGGELCMKISGMLANLSFSPLEQAPAR
jgi:type II secretion system protein N